MKGLACNLIKAPPMSQRLSYLRKALAILAGTVAIAAGLAGAISAADGSVGEGAVYGDLVRDARARRTGVPDNLVIPKDVLRVDGVTYSGQFLVEYITEVLEARVNTDNDVRMKVDDLAVDLTAYDAVLRDMPELASAPVVQQAVAKLKSRILPDIFFLEEVRKKVNLTVDQIAATLPDPPVEYEVRVIVNPDEEKIDAAAKAVAAGDDFGEVARRYSEGLTAGKGGKVTLTEGKFGQFSEEEFRVIRNLKDGESSIPFRGRIGWTIVKLEKMRTPAQLKREDAERNYARYRQQAENAAYEKRIAEIQAKRKLEWNEPGLLRIRTALDNGLPIDDDLRQTVLFTIDGIPVYAYDLDMLTRLHSKPTVDVYLDKRARTEFISREAEQLGYEKQIAGLIDVARRRAAVREYFKRKSKTFAPSEKDFKDYYDRHQDRFTDPEKRRLLIIETASRKNADEAVRRAKKGEDFGTLAGKYNDSEENRQRNGDIMGLLPRTNVHPFVAKDAFTAKQGQVLGPYALKAQDGKTVYAVVKVAEIQKSSVRPIQSMNRGPVGDRIVASRMEGFYRGFFKKVEKEHKVEFLIGKKGGKGQ